MLARFLALSSRVASAPWGRMNRDWWDAVESEGETEGETSLKKSGFTLR